MNFFLLQMACKSGLIAAAGLVLLRLLKKRPAAERVALLRVFIGLLLLLPAASLLAPAFPVGVLPADAAPAAGVEAAMAVSRVDGMEDAMPRSRGVEADGGWNTGTARLVAILYGLGVMAVLMRLVVGIWTLRRWTSTALPVSCPVWTSALARVRERTASTRRVRLLVSRHVPSPLSWGLQSGVILIDPATLRRGDDAAAVLEHEMAHVARHDWPALLLAQLAAALFWFNPLVWQLKRALVQHAEEAADDRAIVGVRPLDYAQMLLNFATSAVGHRVPANHIARGGLARRVEAILKRRTGPARPWSSRSLLAIAGCAACAAPLLVVEIVEASVPPLPVGRIAVPTGQTVPLGAAQGDESRERAPDRSISATPADIRGTPAQRRQAAAQSRRAEEESRIAGEESLRASEENEADPAIGGPEEGRAPAAGPLASRARGMEAGARGLERGAEEMEDKARRLRTSRDYREAQIAEAALLGRTVTHAELLALADGLDRQARGVREDAERLRAGLDEARDPQDI